MKYLVPVFLFIGMACSGPDMNNTELKNDTVQTHSGLRYVYLKRGEGRKVEVGSKLDTKLSLMVEDSVIWNTYSAPDSLFSFVVGVGQVIKGFDEMALLMREGDNVLAILPDSIAYGDKGAGDAIPPNATLVYDRYEIVSASEPRLVPVDTLRSILKDSGIEELGAQFEAITLDTAVFHKWGDYDDYYFVRRVIGDSLYTEAFELAYYLGTLHNDPNTLSLMTMAQEEQGLYQAAIDTLESIIARYPESEFDKEYFESEIERFKKLLEVQ
ncbi:MAG: FKBP-type peptidyl-prolyl cis-trans isomerase [Bacteroidota bacterium]